MGLFDSIFGGSKQRTHPDQVWGTQAPYLSGLYNRAFGASLGLGSGGQMLGSPPSVAGGAGGPRRGHPWGVRGAAGMGGGLQPMGPQLDDPLAQLGGSLTGQGLGMLGNLGMLGQVGNPFAMGQIDQLGQGLGRVFQQQIAPAINSQFAGGGTLGGARQALALGQAGEGLGQAFTGGALDILGNSAQLALGANQAGLGNLGNVFGAGNAATFGSLPGLAGLLGGPTVLGQGGSMRQSNGLLGGVGFNFGF